MTFEDLQKQYDNQDDEPGEDDRCPECGQKRCQCVEADAL